MTKPLQWGLVGLGRISAKHLEAIGQHKKDIELVAVCDTDDAAVAQLPTGFSPTRFTDLSRMLKEADLDIVSICTPSGLHSAQGIAVANAGKHVVVEKPMATAWQDGVRLHQVCRDRKVKLFVVLQNRYNATIQQLKAAIDQGRFGRIYMITSNVFWTRPQSYYDQAPWRGTWEMDGGAFMNQASHYVDMLCWLGGPVSTVQALIATLARNIEAEDTGSAILRYKSGALGSLNVTMLTYPKNREGSITVIGEKGHVRIGGTAMNAIETWEFADRRPEDEKIANASYVTDSVYGEGHGAFYKQVIDCLKRGSNPEIGGEEGLKSLEVLAAIYESARGQQGVILPLARAA